MEPVVFPGLQVYVPPLGLAVAVKVADAPGHIVLEFTLRLGAALTVTTPMAGMLGQAPEV